MSRPQTILCFAPSDWWEMNPSCTTHLMKYLSKIYRVIYVNPFSSDLTVNLGSSSQRSGLTTRIVRKMKSMFRFVRKIHSSLYVVSPFFLPFQGVPWLDRLNNFLITIQLKTLLRCLGVRRPILWIENLRSADFLNTFYSSGIIYHMSDLFTKDSYTAASTLLRRREQAILNAADLVICVSQSLYELTDGRHPRRYYIPHGVDYHLFKEAAEKKENIEELQGVSHPIVGYFGTLTAHNDIELLEYCATHLPTYAFVFAGQITGGNYQPLKQLSNVRFLGRLPYDRIPSLCATIDVGLLPWNLDEWIENCNPLKMFEYLACGKPVVSVPIREAEKYPDCVLVCPDKQTFCQAIESAVLTDSSEKAEIRMKLAQRHSWQEQGHKIQNLIDDLLKHKREEKTDD